MIGFEEARWQGAILKGLRRSAVREHAVDGRGYRPNHAARRRHN
jgi:hypothetical protein